MSAVESAPLQPPPALAAADPAAIAAGARGISAAAQTVRAAAGRASAISAGLPGAAWAGVAAAEFKRAAAEQIRWLGVLAALLAQLAEALRELAGALAVARHDAFEAMARGRQLAARADDVHRRMQTPGGLPPPVIAGLHVEALDLERQLTDVAIQLQGARWRADQAWQRARAAIDFVTYSTPVMHARMAVTSWDPAASVALVAGSGLLDCDAMQELGLPRGGVITGPDGRRYPLVVQTARDRDGRLLVSTEDVSRRAGGWQPLAYRYGTTAYGPKAEAWEKAAVTAGGFAGAGYPDGSTFDPDLLAALAFMPAGGAYVPAAPEDSEADGDVVKEASAEPPRPGQQADYWSRPVSGVAAGRRASVPDAIGLVDGALGGLALAKRLDDGRAAAYRVVFEENATGERRARLQLFRVLTRPGEPPVAVGGGGYVDQSGKLAAVPVTGEDPDRPARMRAKGD